MEKTYPKTDPTLCGAIFIFLFQVGSLSPLYIMSVSFKGNFFRREHFHLGLNNNCYHAFGNKTGVRNQFIIKIYHKVYCSVCIFNFPSHIYSLELYEVKNE